MLQTPTSVWWRTQSCLKFSTVFGTVLPKRAISISPAGSSPIEIVNVTYGKNQHWTKTIQAYNTTTYNIGSFWSLCRVGASTAGTEGKPYEGEQNEGDSHFVFWTLIPRTKMEWASRSELHTQMWRVFGWMMCVYVVGQHKRLPTSLWTTHTYTQR